MNIVLIGMRGSGKTTVGRILALRLNRELVEIDELIAQRAGLDIPEIVARHGWDKFRDVEAEIAEEVARLDKQVIVTGGGVVTREENIRQLKKNGILVWLEAGVDELVKRIGQDTNRPPLVSGRTPRGDIEITLGERVSLYRKAADLVVSTANRTPEAIAIEIIGFLLERGVSPVAAGNTRICCLVGDPVAHSLSPLIHNAGYEALGLDFIYVPFQTKDIKQAIDTIKALGIHGVSVTIPYKTTVVSYLDSIDEAARGIGAVNTIVNNNGTLTGFNTDGIAAVKALEETIFLEGKKAVLVGAGGAAAAIAVGLKKKGVELVILNRTVEKARNLARLVNAEASDGLEQLAMVSSVHILINATSVGMWPKINESIIPKELLHDRLTVFDIVYNPKETRLLREAREKGGTIIYGYKMFLYQAAIQFELFTGCQAPLAVMERALLKASGG
jgi:shikimate dehydrogenase